MFKAKKRDSNESDTKTIKSELQLLDIMTSMTQEKK